MAEGLWVGEINKTRPMYYVYVLNCIDSISGARDLYIGFTKDLRNRVKEHKSGEVKTTKKFNKINLVYYEACLSEDDARKRELQLKTGFGRGYLKRRLENSLK